MSPSSVALATALILLFGQEPAAASEPSSEPSIEPVNEPMSEPSSEPMSEPSSEPVSEVEGPEPEPSVTAPPSPLAAPPPPPAPVEVDPRNYRMVLAGDIVVGFAGASLIAMVAGLGIRSDAVSQRQALISSTSPDEQAIAKQARRVELGTILAIAGGATAGAAFATGITLIALGYSRERKRREALGWIPAPSFGRGSVTLVWSLPLPRLRG